MLEIYSYCNLPVSVFFRYTPLDYALMGEHHDVAQYMIEQGGLSITGIQDIAAQKIQVCVRARACMYVCTCDVSVCMRVCEHMWCD